MQELEKILEEIDQRIEKAEKIIVDHPSDKLDEIANDTDEAFIEAYKECQDIIHKHLSRENDPEITRSSRDSICGECSRRKWYQIGYKDGKNDGWIPVEEWLPENAKYKGAFCQKYQVMTKYGVTEGWYNPDYESWYLLIWFMTDRHMEHEIDFDRGDVPKVVRCPDEVNKKDDIVIAWRPLPKPYRPERTRP